MTDLKSEIERLRKSIFRAPDESLEYMSDMNNWVCVHATRYEPKINNDGKMYIQTTAMATDNTLPRASVHTTLNKIVSGNSGGNWDDTSIVVLTPYKDIVSQNVNPQEVSVDDTYFIPNPDTGLVLPDSTYIIRSDPNSVDLINIGEHDATYKTDHYTEEDIKQILSLNSWSEQEYETYMNGDVPESDVKWILGHNERFIKAYQMSKDKKAFMRGVFKEDRYILLNKLLRDVAVEKALDKMGYHYVSSHEDDISARVAKLAREAGLRGCENDKGHSASLECDLEVEGCMLAGLADVLKSKDIDQICECLIQSNFPLCDKITSSILTDKPLPEFYSIYEEVFKTHIESIKRSSEWNLEQKDEILCFANKLERGGIKGYNPFLDIVLHRQADKMKQEMNQALSELKQQPEVYTELQQRLKNDTQTKKVLGGFMMSKKSRS